MGWMVSDVTIYPGGMTQTNQRFTTAEEKTYFDSPFDADFTQAWNELLLKVSRLNAGHA